MMIVTRYEVLLEKLGKSENENNDYVVFSVDNDNLYAAVQASTSKKCPDGSVVNTLTVKVQSASSEAHKKLKDFFESRRSLKDPTAYVVMEDYGAVLRHDFTEPDEYIIGLTDESGPLKIVVHKIEEDVKPDQAETSDDYS